MDAKLKNYYLFSVPVSFEIAKLHIPFSRHIIVELSVNDKMRYGEGVIYKTSLQQTERLLQGIINKEFGDDRWRKVIDGLVTQEPGLAAALDQAIFAWVRHSLPRQRYTKQVFIMPLDLMLAEIDGLVRDKCRAIKLKLGRDAKQDIKLINILARRYPQIKFKADVNCGYGRQEFEKVLQENKGFIEIWEEPVEKKYQSDLINIKQKYGIKIMLDESVQSLGALERYCRVGIIDVLNIKLSRVGGIRAAMKYIDYCRKNNLEISVGCSEELGIGMKAIDYLARVARRVVGIEGVGSERLDFDIVDDEKKFSLSRLQRASRLLNFQIFSEKAKMSFFDKFQMFCGSKYAKFRNACLYGQRLFSK